MDQELTEMPSLSKLYFNAAATAAKSRLLRSQPEVSLPERAVEVKSVSADLAKATAFSHLMGEVARDVLPSGYIHALAFPVTMSVMVQDDFPLPLLGMIHLSNRIQHCAPILFTDLVNIRSWARDLRGHRSGTQVEMVTELHSADGLTLLWKETSLYLAKGVYLPGIDKPETTHPAPRELFTPPHPTAQWRLGVDIGREYAAVSGDFNPIHLSALTAKALGMRRSIAHGMYAASRILSDIGTHAEAQFTWSIDFEAPMFLPATVALNVQEKFKDDADWLGSDFIGWNSRSGRRHFSGSVVPGVVL